MELSAQYAFTPKPSALNKGLPFRWASFTREDGTAIDTAGNDGHVEVAKALQDGPVFAQYDKAVAPELRAWLRQGQPNCFLPLDRSGVDPFTERWPVTLRCEGTVRGVGGIRLTGDNCSTGVPGLYAAGDAASREALTGAITGGGGPNSSWAIASGTWAGRAAAIFAAQIAGRVDDRPVTPLGGAGLQPTAGDKETPSAAEIAETVRAEMLPLERNFFRRADALRNSLGRLDSAWSDLRRRGPVDGLAAAKMREAAAMIATSRWAYARALARSESRGMHRRIDAPSSDPSFACSFETAGLDRVGVIRRELGQGAPAR